MPAGQQSVRARWWLASRWVRTVAAMQPGRRHGQQQPRQGQPDEGVVAQPIEQPAVAACHDQEADRAPHPDTAVVMIALAQRRQCHRFELRHDRVEAHAKPGHGHEQHDPGVESGETRKAQRGEHAPGHQPASGELAARAQSRPRRRGHDASSVPQCQHRADDVATVPVGRNPAADVGRVGPQCAVVPEIEQRVAAESAGDKRRDPRDNLRGL